MKSQSRNDQLRFGAWTFIGHSGLVIGLSMLACVPALSYNHIVPDLSVNLRGLSLANPTLTCSGTCGYAFEYADFMDLSKLGAFVTKSITLEERSGNEPARIVEVRAGMLNAI